MRAALTTIAVLLVAGAVTLAIGLRNARAVPLVRHATVALNDWPVGAAPIAITLLSDIHMGNRAMDRDRLAAIVGQVEATKPDLILLAGDFIAGHDAGDAIRAAPDLAPLRGLHAPLGVIAVLGNHDYWTDAPVVRRSLAENAVALLANRSIRAGPVLVGGLDDQPTGHADAGALLRTMTGKAGARIIVAHSPDIAATLPNGLDLVLAGHTHCGQIVLPLIGPPVSVSSFGDRYRCGLIREGRRSTIVTAGIGTSVLSIRFGAPPDIWSIRVGPRVSPPRP